MPIFLVVRWLAGLVSLAIIGAAIYLLWTWNQGVPAYDAAGRPLLDAAGHLLHRRGPDWRLWTGVGLLGWSFLGRFVVLALFPKSPAEPDLHRSEGGRIRGADGADLWVESYGPKDRPTLVMTHGWGLDSSAWSSLKPALAARYRLVLWDLPGLGRSKGPSGGRYTLEGFASDLRAVVESVGARQVVLIGHSIGGMTVQTLLRDHPEFARERVAGVALVDTTYRNPIDTLVLSGLWRVLRFPLIEPLCWVQIALSPVVHLMSWKSWLDGTAHLAARLGFGRHAPRAALDHVARLAAYNAPGVQAKGDLAMFRWSVEGALPAMSTPMLVLGGTADIITLPRAAEHIAATVPTARLVKAEGAGHMGYMEQPRLYGDAILKFADEVLGRPVSSQDA